MQSQRRLIVVSVVLHLALLATLLHVRRMQVEAMKFPGTANGTRISLTYSPGGAAAQSSMAAVKPVAAKIPQTTKSIREKQTHALTATTTAPPSANPGAAQGGDARGSGNVTVALATFFPRPTPDLTALSHGTRGDEIVEVTIDEQGKIVESQVSQSLGAAIDQVVLATIQTWTFKPATKDGVPVPSQQELLFHYERG